MTQMVVGYIRVSTESQNIDRQEKIMRQEEVDRVFCDRSSGMNDDREQLKIMMEFVREGDCVVVESISRFARNTVDLIKLVEKLEKKKVEFRSISERIDTTTPTGRFMLTIFGAVAELEREYIRKRQREGIEIAKTKEVYKGRKPKEIPHFEIIYKEWEKGSVTTDEAITMLGVSRSTFYRRCMKISNVKK